MIDVSNKAYNTALRSLGFASKTRGQMETYLLDKGFEEDAVMVALDKLERYGFINDAEYAGRWVKRAVEHKPKGKRMMAHELRLRGIEEQVIADALRELDDKQQQAMATRVACLYFKRYNGADKSKLMFKVSQALMRKGFDREIIGRVLRAYQEE